jgi:hypothetical protein
MPLRLVALEEGSDIPIDRDMLIIGRHPQCDARLDSIRISRRHCCMTRNNEELLVRDLGSTNGIRINGQRVEQGRLRVGDELSIAHIRFRLDDGQGQEMTLAEPSSSAASHREAREPLHPAFALNRVAPASVEENPLAAAVREMLPPGVADRCRIQVIVQMQPDEPRNGHGSRPPAERPGTDGDLDPGLPDPSSSS